MIARFDHRPMLTAVLALTTAVLVVMVITLSALLITAATSSSQSGDANPGAAGAVPGTGENYGDGWNNYGHDTALPRPAQTGNGANSAVDRHAEVVAAYNR